MLAAGRVRKLAMDNLTVTEWPRFLIQDVLIEGGRLRDRVQLGRHAAAENMRIGKEKGSGKRQI